MSVARDEWDRLVELHPALTEWRFEISTRLTDSAGWTYWQPKVVRIAEWLILRASDDEIIDTVRHEAAHALTPGEHHGPAWRQLAVELGARPHAEYPYEILPLRASARRRPA